MIELPPAASINRNAMDNKELTPFGTTNKKKSQQLLIAAKAKPVLDKGEKAGEKLDKRGVKGDNINVEEIYKI